MRLALTPRTSEFYELFARAGENALEAARRAERRFREFPSASVSQADVKAIETAGDAITRDLIQLLNTQYITPFDREDIYELATALDDVVDNIEEASDLLELYGVEQPTRQSIEQCRILVGAVEHLCAALARLKGWRVLQGEGIVDKVLIPSLAAPILGFAGAALIMLVLLRIIALALISTGHLSAEEFDVPLWVIVSAAIAMGMGTYVGGWRIIRTLGQRVAKLEPPQGFAAETTTATILWVTGNVGFPVSTTHTISGSVLGAGASRRLSAVRWGVAGNILVAWLLTIPAAGTIGAAMELLTRAPGGTLIVFLLMAAIAAAAFQARRAQTRATLAPASARA